MGKQNGKANIEKPKVYTWEQGADNVGYIATIGPVDDVLLDGFSEFEQTDGDYAKLTFHSSLDKAEEYLKSRCDNYDQLKKDGYIAYNRPLALEYGEDELKNRGLTFIDNRNDEKNSVDVNKVRSKQVETEFAGINFTSDGVTGPNVTDD